jgi:hypothetical protein
MAFAELSDQVKIMREMNPGTIPVPLITLERTMFPTGFGGKKARPLFKIVGYKLRSQIGAQNLLTSETKPVPSLKEEMGGDEIPFNDPIPPDLENENAESPKVAAPPLATPRRDLKKPPTKTSAKKPPPKRASNILGAG